MTTTLLAFPAIWVPRAHTTIAALAFTVALLMGWMSGLWAELCQNSVAGWPVEWFPSVSATIGDHAPPRAPFQIFIALCATPRFLLLLVQWLVHRYPPSSSRSSMKAPYDTNGSSTSVETASIRERLKTRTDAGRVREMVEDVEAEVDNVLGHGGGTADLELFVGVARTFCCGGWVYITSRDHHDLHDLFMIVYLVLTLPWMLLSTQNSTTPQARSRRQIVFAGFLLTIPPLIWLYYRHSVLRIPGAYTYYSFFEWSLVFWDVAFDAIATQELSHLKIAVIDVSSHAKTHGDLGLEQNAFLPALPKRKTNVETEIDWTSNATTVGDNVKVPSWPVWAWLSDVYFATCFWTVFTSLGFQLFYWSVWKLALAGSELALLANLSAFTLSSPTALSYVTSRRGMLIHRTIMVLAGMASYCIPSVAARLIGVSIGTWVGWLSLYGNWSRLKGSQEMIAESKIWMTGLVITLVIKYMSASMNPLWVISNEATGGWNKTGLFLAGLSLLEYTYRPLDLFPSAPILVLDKKTDKPRVVVSPTRWQVRLIALGLGCLIHLLQTLVTDAGTIIAWTWTGYPIKGPTLHPFAGVVIATASLGLLIPVHSANISWSAIGCLGAATLYCFPDWLGFLGGLVVIAYLTSIVPLYLRAASSCPPSKVFGQALLFNIILDVLSVITAAYAFVPFGWLLRERTDAILAITMGCVVLGERTIKGIALPGEEHMTERAKSRTERTKRWTVIAAAVLSVTGIGYGYGKMPTEKPVPYYPDHRIFSGGIWAVHFGVDEAGRDSQRRMLDLIRDMQVDVVGLLETDLHRFVYGNRDLTRLISEELGYYVDLGPGPNKHTWGAALLSKFPIINSTHHLLPSPVGELAPAIHATLDVHGERVDVFVSHNGQEEDLLDRTLQTTEIARLLNSTYPTPSVFLGYLVTHAGDQRPWPYQILHEDGRMYDIEIEDRWRWCEYIAFRGLWRIGFARIFESDITDTELQVGKFMLPLPGESVVYQSNQEMYWHIGEKDVPEPWRMPGLFRGEGTRGHVYRIWDGPLYYLPPIHSKLRRYGWDWSTSLDAA
ncbi:Frag1/DRAM/Sfk1 family-domain-containing protein [Naematelia encephala]|uniref:Frag1/DRAM/Sfk1 family-domain-containing protein n=1 Tax=Naematelia encephala TaxID=71784 RepID=A0A1Y2BM05_9TREE|nr:Frag1/DRAM/Sfk1 family-domain-containing protein [Naematelia encephala]